MEAKAKIMSEYARFLANLNVLREVAEEYHGKTIDSIIVQMEMRRKEIGNSAENNKTI